MQRRRIESSRNKETTKKKNVGRDSDKTLTQHTQAENKN